METKRTTKIHFSKLQYSFFAVHDNLESLKAELSLSTRSTSLQNFQPLYLLPVWTNKRLKTTITWNGLT